MVQKLQAYEKCPFSNCSDLIASQCRIKCICTSWPSLFLLPCMLYLWTNDQAGFQCESSWYCRSLVKQALKSSLLSIGAVYLCTCKLTYTGKFKKYLFCKKVWQTDWLNKNESSIGARRVKKWKERNYFFTLKDFIFINIFVKFIFWQI